MSADTRFWWLNTLPWALYAVLNLSLAMIAFPARQPVLLLLVICIGLPLLLYFISAGIRHLVRRRDWLKGTLWRVALRLLVLVVAGACLAQLVLHLLLRALVALGWVVLPASPSGAGMQWVYLVNTGIILGMWVLAWAGITALQQARHSAMAQLRAEAERERHANQVLRARLNPHFVFNALNNLRGLIAEDPDRARDMVGRLSNTLRHALEHTRGEQVSLAEELALVRDYLAVEAVHYEQRLQLHWQIDQAALPLLLPAMSLQLLVENAVRHGIAQTAGGGVLGIRAQRAADGSLQLEVRNPGQLQRSGENPAGGHGHGVGLAYLHKAGALRLLQQHDQVVARLEVMQ